MRTLVTAVVAALLTAAAPAGGTEAEAGHDAAGAVRAARMLVAEGDGRGRVDARMLSSFGGPERVSLGLPGGRVVGATRSSLEQFGLGRVVWTGVTDAGKPAAFATRGGSLTGFVVTASGETVRVRGRSDGAVTFSTEAPLDEPYCELCAGAVGDAGGLGRPAVEAAGAPSAPLSEGDQAFSIGCDAGSPIDVLVAYTTRARIAAGGMAAIEAEIDLAVSNTNQAYAASGVTTMLRLVGTIETPYDEVSDGGGSLGAILNDLRDNPFGVVDGVFAARDVLGADLVALAVEGGFGSSLGIASLSGEFSVSRWDRLSPFVFAHEIGHNRGCGHEPSDPGAAREFPFASAHFFEAPAGVERSTIMNATTSFRTVLRFSNPGVLFEGVPTGVSGVSDNARAMNTTAARTAAVRCAIEGCTEAYQIGPRSASSSFGFTVDEIVWMNQFEVRPGAEEIVQIDIEFGAAGGDVMVALWDDPNNDGFPDDASLIAAFGPVPTGRFEVSQVRIPPTFVGSVGESFFVGAGATNAASVSGILPAEVGSFEDGRSFQMPFVRVDNVPSASQFSDFGVNYAVIARGASTLLDCNGNGEPDACDIAEGVELDTDGNGVPDSCESVACSAADLAEPFGVLGSEDIEAAVAAAVAGGASVDLAPPAGTVDVFDLLSVLRLFDAGCP